MEFLKSRLACITNFIYLIKAKQTVMDSLFLRIRLQQSNLSTYFSKLDHFFLAIAIDESSIY
jgi:hypothetical protein